MTLTVNPLAVAKLSRNLNIVLRKEIPFAVIFVRPFFFDF